MSVLRFISFLLAYRASKSLSCESDDGSWRDFARRDKAASQSLRYAECHIVEGSAQIYTSLHRRRTALSLLREGVILTHACSLIRRTLPSCRPRHRRKPTHRCHVGPPRTPPSCDYAKDILRTPYVGAFRDDAHFSMLVSCKCALRFRRIVFEDAVTYVTFIFRRSYFCRWQFLLFHVFTSHIST